MLRQLATNYAKKQALIENFRRVVKDERLAEKIIKNATTRELQLATFVAIEHGADTLRQLYRR